jgi:3',5'-cyclic AMP phosphodiesterase CpdA
MRVAWLTDIHLDHLDEAAIDALGRRIAGSDPGAVAISGDISVASRLPADLERLGRAAGRPVHFVLGNHDFYGSAIEPVRAAARGLAGRGLVWLPAAGVVPLTGRSAMVGIDGWGDARLGSPLTTPVLLNDFILIDDLRLPRRELVERLRAIGDAEAELARAFLGEALARFEHVLVVTHVPPWREACWHDGRLSDDDWLPWFTCKAVGDVLLELAAAHPARAVTVVCGHTHGAGETSPLPNLTVRTGGAEYGAPVLQPPIELP